MITANIGKNHVRVYGHAGTAPIGHDLVCAGASTLLYALAVRLQELEDAGAVKGLQAVFRPGFSEIRWENAGAGGNDTEGLAAVVSGHYGLPPALRATSLSEGGMRAADDRPYGCGTDSSLWEGANSLSQPAADCSLGEGAMGAVAFYAAGMRMLEEDNPGCIRVK